MLGSQGKDAVERKFKTVPEKKKKKSLRVGGGSYWI